MHDVAILGCGTMGEAILTGLQRASQLTVRATVKRPIRADALRAAHGIEVGHDNAVAESFFQLLKRERIRRRAYPVRDDARRDVIDYFEMLYTPKRKHMNNGIRSPVEIEEGQLKLKQAGV